MKEFLIHLSMKQRSILMDSASQYSDTWRALNDAVRPRFWSAAGNSSEYIVVCTEPVANALLHLARTFCMEALAAIDLAVADHQTEETGPHLVTVSDA
jgi:hypothetical protein